MSRGSWPELWNRSELVDWQETCLIEQLKEVVPANPFWKQKFQTAGIDPVSIRSLADLSLLPFTTKSELAKDQSAFPPYGTNLTFPVTDYSRLHQTSGTTTGSPLRWLDTPASWNWMLDGWSTIYRLLGLRRDDRLCFPFSFGPFLGFWAGFEGAARQAGAFFLYLLHLAARQLPRLPKQPGVEAKPRSLHMSQQGSHLRAAAGVGNRRGQLNSGVQEQ